MFQRTFCRASFRKNIGQLNLILQYFDKKYSVQRCKHSILRSTQFLSGVTNVQIHRSICLFGVDWHKLLFVVSVIRNYVYFYAIVIQINLLTFYAYIFQVSRNLFDRCCNQSSKCKPLHRNILISQRSNF